MVEKVQIAAAALHLSLQFVLGAFLSSSRESQTKNLYFDGIVWRKIFICGQIYWCKFCEKRNIWQNFPTFGYFGYFWNRATKKVQGINLKSIFYKKILKNWWRQKNCKNCPTETGQKQGVIRANFFVNTQL